MTHTYCDASWNTENQDIREAVEQSAQRGRAVRGEKAEKAATSRAA